MTADRPADIARGAGALAATIALVAGVPAGLWRLAGWPLPRSMPAWPGIREGLRASYVPDELLIHALAIACWLAWAQLLACLAVETAALARGRVPARVPLAGPVQDAAARLVAAIALIGTLSSPRPVLAGDMPPLSSQLALAAEPAVSDSQPTAEPNPAVRRISEEPAPTYIVQSRDDLWSIAERHLGDPLRWPEIFDRNRGRGQPDGRTFRDPDLICPGWILELPAAGLAPPAALAAAPQASSDSVGAVPMRPGAQSAEQPAPTTTTTSERPTVEDGGPRADAGGHHEQADDADPARRAPGVELPSGAIVGASLAAGISATLAAARLHRRRRYAPADPQPGIARTDPLTSQLIGRLRRAHLARADTAEIQVGQAEPTGPSPIDESAPHQQPAGTVTIGHRADQPVLVDLATMGGLCLAGPAAIDAARAVLIDLLAGVPADTVQIVLAGVSLARHLLPDVEPIPSLEVVDSLDAALAGLEVELIHRTRQFDDADFRDYTRRHPEEPMPALILFTAEPEPAASQRLTAVLNLGRRLGIGALILGVHPTLPSITGDTDGQVSGVEPAGALPELSGARLCTLTRADAAAMLALIGAAHGAESAPDDAQAETEPFPVEPVACRPVHAPISVCLLGPMRIDAAGEEIRTGLRSKARELLAFFLLHPRGATAEATADALWPDADVDRGIERFRTVLGNLRSTLRATAGLDADTMLIERRGERYQADATLIDCDLWRFQAALAEAATAPDEAGASVTLGQAAQAYAGDLLEGAYYEWAEPAREDLRRRAIDALAKLAELHQAAGDPDAALDALNQAIRHDPYAEELYRRIMRLQATLSRPDAIRRTYRLLETRLTDLDTDPAPTTTHLLHELLHNPRKHQPRT